MNYEEFDDKYHKSNEYKHRSHRLAKVRPVPFVNIEGHDNIQLYVDTSSLPKIYDNTYNQIERFPDYDYINSISYEMLIRTIEYKKIDKNRKITIEEKTRSLDQLGVDLYEVRSFKTRNNPRRAGFNIVEKNFSESNYDLRICDIHDGMKKLIHFYLEKKQIFRRVKYTENMIGMITEIEYKTDTNATYKDILSNPLDFYIPAKFDYQNPNNKHKISKIDNDISLHALENEFLTHIEISIPNNIRGKISFNYTRPLLRFKESANVDVTINLNLSKKVILDLISKLKNEFDSGSVQTSIGFLFDKNYLINDWKKNISFKFTKKSMSRAFFVYDLYTAIDVAFQIKKNQLKIIKDKELERINNNFVNEIRTQEKKTTDDIENLSTSIKNKEESKVEFRKDLKIKKKKLTNQKERDIKKIKNKYKSSYKTFHTKEVLIGLLSEHDITAYTCKKYLQFMRKYITHSKYKELIIGTESKT